MMKMNKEILLVNKEYGLSSDYVPDDLVIVDNNENNFHRYVNPKLKPMIKKEVLYHFNELKNDALKDNLNIIIDSGYRSYDYQKEIYLKNLIKKYYELKRELISITDLDILKESIKKVNKMVAIPGHSEHQSGLAIDIACFRNNIYSDEIINSDEEIWMKENSYKYGFILRYPENKEYITGYNYEPWHYRYVGIDISSEIKNDITLEEYLLIKK